MADQDWTVWGIDLSYFTGKVEAILRAKGIAYHRNNLTAQNWPAMARKIGIQHMPYVEMPDGRFLSDTTLILRYLEDHHDGPSLTPVAGPARFISRLIEDYADEWLWRPAMYYRWHVPESRNVSSARIVDQVAAAMPAPRWLKKRFVIRRQLGTYVIGDGVKTKAQRAATEHLYVSLLDELDGIFATRPFLMGDRPTDADFGLFGPFFRHFFGDPVPGAIMQDRAPHVLLWAARLWATKPADFADVPLIDKVPADLAPIIKRIAEEYAPYMRANADAVAASAKTTSYQALGVAWTEYTKPFRLWCLSDMIDEYAALSEAEQSEIASLLGDTAMDLLTAPLPAEPVPPASLPITLRADGGKAVDSWMR